MKLTERCFSLFVLSLVAVAQMQVVSAQAVTIAENLRLPIAIEVFVPCANGGAGETVSLAGTLHEVFHVTIDANGDAHFKIHDQPQGIRGIGQTSGVKYQATGVTQTMSNTNPATFVNNFRIIGQGPGNNFLIHQVMHVTVNAKGEVTASFDHVSTECR